MDEQEQLAAAAAREQGDGSTGSLDADVIEKLQALYTSLCAESGHGEIAFYVERGRVVRYRKNVTYLPLPSEN